MSAPRKNDIRELALLAGSIAIALILAEAICRLALPRPGFAALSGDWLPGAIQSNPSRLYGLVPGFSAHIADSSTGAMQFDINADGLRERPLAAIREASLRILALGDSFTFGVSIGRAQAWPGRLEAELQRRGDSVAVVNAGVPGYSLAQMEDSAREFLPKTDPALVVAGIYAGGLDRLTDPFTALDDLVIRSSQVRFLRHVGNGVIRSRMYNPALVEIDLWLMQHWYFGARLFEVSYDLLDSVRNRLFPASGAHRKGTAQRPALADIPAGLAYLERLHRRTDAAGIPLVVFIVTGFGPANTVGDDQLKVAAALKGYCESAGIYFVDPTEALRSSGEGLQVRPGNYHWSARANALAARELAKYLLDHGLVRGHDDRAKSTSLIG